MYEDTLRRHLDEIIDNLGVEDPDAVRKYKNFKLEISDKNLRSRNGAYFPKEMSLYGEEEFNPFKKFCAMFFACEVVTFIAFMTLYTYCYVKREFLKFYMFLIYAVLETLFMLFCASVGAGEAFFIALFMHPFYSLFFIGFLFSKSSKRMNSVETLILILHSSAFLVLPAFGGAMGEGTYPLFGLVISSMMFYIALLLLADMYNHGNPFANNKPTPPNTKKVNANGVEMFKSTVYKQYSKNNMYSNYKKFLGISPKHWFNTHYKEFSDSLFIWYMLIIVV